MQGEIHSILVKITIFGIREVVYIYYYAGVL